MSSFFKDGIVLPKPTQVARTKIRNLYEDGYPGAAHRPERHARAAIITVTTKAFPWYDPGSGYRLDGKTNIELPDRSGIKEPGAPHEDDMIDRGRIHLGPGPVTGLLGDGGLGGGATPCPDPSDMDPSDAGWSPEDDCE